MMFNHSEPNDLNSSECVFFLAIIIATICTFANGPGVQGWLGIVFNNRVEKISEHGHFNHFHFQVSVDFIRVKSYDNLQSTGEIKIIGGQWRALILLYICIMYACYC